MKTNRKNTHLYICYPENYPEEIIESEISEFYNEKLKIVLEKKDYGAFNGIEWYLPTILMAVVLQPYFSGFMSEMGKDHYEKLKRGLKKIASFGKRRKYISITSDLTSDKLSKNYHQSLSVSLTFETINKKKIKLLFDNDLEKSDWDDAIDQLFDFVIENYEKYPTDRLSKKISGLEANDWKSIYAIINKSTKRIDFFDERGMMEKFKN